MNKITLASAVLSLLSMSAIGACAAGTSLSDDWSATSRGGSGTLISPVANAGCAATMPTRGGAPYRGMPADPPYGGDFRRMVQTYGGILPARAVLGQICVSQAPALVLTVYRPGDEYRDGWCVARYGEAARVQEVEDRSSGACREGRS